jgi:N-acyl-D-amino-acid deacylase
MSDILIKNGTVVDGTGAPAYAADVRIKGGVIAEVGKDLASGGERIIDANGCYVTPGFIESHTHYDASMWWQPDLDPLPGYGATTMVQGNCGFSMAPLHPSKQARDEVMGIFSFFEDIPIGPFQQNVPWDWCRSTTRVMWAIFRFD